MIRIDESQMARAKLVLDGIPKGIEKAASRALNRAIESGMVEAARKSREQYFVSAADVRASIRINRATESKLIASAISRGTKRELSQFRVSPLRVGKPLPKMLRVAVKKDGGLKDLPGAFLARGKSSGKLHVLARVEKTRYPIHVKYGPSVPEMIGVEKIKPYVEAKARDVLQVRLDHEISRLLKG
ncbi:MAG: phage tail protein [Sporomusaceae bacterium]|nr:phage tail protein [Sporomusaceae bacterium]